jgi:hypothetical protein
MMISKLSEQQLQFKYSSWWTGSALEIIMLKNRHEWRHLYLVDWYYEAIIKSYQYQADCGINNWLLLYICMYLGFYTNPDNPSQNVDYKMLLNCSYVGYVYNYYFTGLKQYLLLIDR